MARSCSIRLASSAMLAGTLVMAGLQAQGDKAAKDGDWPMYNRDLAGTRYSPLKQIDRVNVARAATASWAPRWAMPWVF